MILWLVVAGLTLVVIATVAVWQQRKLKQQRRDFEAELAEKEQELLAAEKVHARIQRMESLGRLVGGVAHDFNNLFYVILGNLELLNARSIDEQSRAHVSDALSATKKGSELTKQLLAFGRRSHLQPTQTDVAETLQETSNMLEHVLPKTVELVVESDDDLWPVRVDRSGLENAILNCVLNASDAIESAGQVRITAKNKRVDTRDAAMHDGEEIVAGRYVLISVIDDGVGMEPAVAERAFEPFFTTKRSLDSSGLGLSSVFGFCRQSGGGCRIETSPGAGTTIQLLLPVQG